MGARANTIVTCVCVSRNQPDFLWPNPWLQSFRSWLVWKVPSSCFCDHLTFTHLFSAEVTPLVAFLSLSFVDFLTKTVLNIEITSMNSYLESRSANLTAARQSSLKTMTISVAMK